MRNAEAKARFTLIEMTAVMMIIAMVSSLISDERGRIDIAKAPAKVLAPLFRSAGADEDATVLAQSSAAWRKGDGPDHAANRVLAWMPLSSLKPAAVSWPVSSRMTNEAPDVFDALDRCARGHGRRMARLTASP